MALNINNRAGSSIPPAAVQSSQSGGAAPTTWKDAPVVNQLHPQGARAAHYRNGIYNCAGAVAATLARMLGTRKGQSDADLINDLSRGRTTREGTTPAALAEMIKDVGAKVDGQAITGAYSNAELDALLAKGDKVVAQVGMRNRATGSFDPHYIIVDGKTKDGDYIIKDPLKGQYTATADQLRQAVYQAPGAGGMLIPVAPAGARPSDSPAVAPAPLEPTSQLTKVSTDTPFQTDDQQIQGVDTAFKPYVTDAFTDYQTTQPTTDPRTNDLLFGKGPSKPTSPEAPRQVSPDKTAKGYADYVLGLLRNGWGALKALGQRLFGKLERSANPVDQKAYEAIQDQYAKQPGIGQRPGYSGYGNYW